MPETSGPQEDDRERAPDAAVGYDVAALRDLAERAARAAGALVRQGRPDKVEVASTKSSAVDVVTQMDLAAERELRRLLAQERPHDGVLGEEGGLQPGTSGVTWVLDPVDGTVNYLYGLPAYAVSVAAVAGPPDPAAWTLLAGCVHAVADGRTWTAGRGLGASLDGRPVRVNDPAPLAESLCGTGFGYRAERRSAQARVLVELLPRVRDIRRIGSAAMDLCLVASGGLDVYYERGLNPWDLAAGQLVAQEAGAVVTGLRGEPAGSAMTVAGPEPTVRDLAHLLQQWRADEDDAAG
ncbi:MAG: inositol monophosphatase [Actinotalea sp.]|nr:inositol monophosphatase [Actinotalea sp.]